MVNHSKIGQKCLVLEWLAIILMSGVIRPFEYRTLKSPVFRWIWFSGVRYSDGYCIPMVKNWVVQWWFDHLVTKPFEDPIGVWLTHLLVFKLFPTIWILNYFAIKIPLKFWWYEQDGCQICHFHLNTGTFKWQPVFQFVFEWCPKSKP